MTRSPDKGKKRQGTVEDELQGWDQQFDAMIGNDEEPTTAEDEALVVEEDSPVEDDQVVEESEAETKTATADQAATLAGPLTELDSNDVAQLLQEEQDLEVVEPELSAPTLVQDDTGDKASQRFNKATSEQPPTGNVDDASASRPAQPVDKIETSPLGSASDLPVQEEIADQKLSPATLTTLPLEKPLPEGDQTWLTTYDLYRSEIRAHVSVGAWQQLAALTAHAVLHAQYATGATRSSMLLDLGRLYRDRLHDQARAEETFSLLARENPANGEALNYLGELYVERSQWRAVYDLFYAAVEATWDPNERQEWTEQIAEIAVSRLDDVGLAIQAWENLWRLGDAKDAAARALARYYRQASRWADLARFLQHEAADLEGPRRILVLRELAEVFLSAVNAPEQAAEVLQQIASERPQDPVSMFQLVQVHAHREDAAALNKLKEEIDKSTLSPNERMDLQQVIGDALWQSGAHDLAVDAYEHVLAIDPSSEAPLSRKQAYLEESQQYEALVSHLLARAEATSAKTDRAQFLEQAALLAEQKLERPDQAIDLWRQNLAIAEHATGYEALTRLCRQVGDNDGLADSLDKQLALTKDPNSRADLLRSLGRHCKDVLKEDDRAETCWKSVLALDPSDQSVRAELIELHRRRGDFEALNSALLRQIWLTDSSDNREQALHLCRLAAENADDNLKSAERSIEAWHRVLDFAPADASALDKLSRHYETTKNIPQSIHILEQQLRAADDLQARVQIGLRIAKLWEECDQQPAAIASYERILCWQPDNRDAIDALLGRYYQQQPLFALDLIEEAAAHQQTAAAKVEFLERALPLFGKEQAHELFSHLARILWLRDGDMNILTQMRELATSKPLLCEYALVLEHLIAEESDLSKRTTLIDELSTLYEKKLKKPSLAYLVRQSVILQPTNVEQLIELDSVAKRTGHCEDLLAALQTLTSVAHTFEVRKAAILQRARICEGDLKDLPRALGEHRRLLLLDPKDWAPLAEIERLAKASEAWLQLDAAIVQLADTAEGVEARTQLLIERQRTVALHANDADTVRQYLARHLRLGSDQDAAKMLRDSLDQRSAWLNFLPLLEARSSANHEEPSSAALIQIAADYQNECNEIDRAAFLLCQALLLNPSEDSIAKKLKKISSKASDPLLLANTFRLAAAIATDADQPLALLSIAASTYERVSAKEEAIDVRRRILALNHDDKRSLETLVAWHRQRNEWRDLRDRLSQWALLCDGGKDRIEAELEIATISIDKLVEPTVALSAFTNVLSIDANHAVAQKGLDTLVEQIVDPKVRLSWLEIEVAKSETPPTQLRLEIAQLQQEALGKTADAIETLEQDIAQNGAASAAYEPLVTLLEEASAHVKLARLLCERAKAVDEMTEKLSTLDRAAALAQLAADPDEQLLEEIYRLILEARPSDVQVSAQLSAILRRANRHEEMAELIKFRIDQIESSDDRLSLTYELARLYTHHLDQPQESATHWRRILALSDKENGARLALATLMLAQNDFDAYLELRQATVPFLPASEGAHVLCYLAEFCDEHQLGDERIAAFYREARKCDPKNEPATEALKSIGRGLKSLRPQAALLALEGEHELTPVDRADRLAALGNGNASTDINIAIDWYSRATATDPDNATHWFALADALDRTGDVENGYRARLAGRFAFERTQPITQDNLDDYLGCLLALAKAAKQSGHPDEYRKLISLAHEVLPNRPEIELAMAELLIENDEMVRAQANLQQVLLSPTVQLTETQRVTAHYLVGAAQIAAGEPRLALEAFSQALKLNPLDPESLIQITSLFVDNDRIGAAIVHLTRALTVIDNAERRAEIYQNLGALWEDKLDALEDAGACYEVAIGEGLQNQNLLQRTLRHYQRDGRIEDCLAIVDRLLPETHDAQELADLWLLRGTALALDESSAEEAIEAFDMALSYAPGRQDVRDALSKVLQGRGDWHQLLQVLEASCDTGTPVQQAKILQQMATIAQDHLSDANRARQLLEKACQLSPVKEVLLPLADIYRQQRENDALCSTLSKLIAVGPPWFAHCQELGSLSLAEHPRKAWALLSPLLGVSQIDATIKTKIQDMRKAYERPPIFVPEATDAQSIAKQCDLDNEFYAALASIMTTLSGQLTPGQLATESDSGIGDLVAVPAGAGIGKIFSAVVEATGLEEIALFRTQTLPEAVRIVPHEKGLRLIVRTEVLQQLVHAEVGFLFNYGLTLLHPAHRFAAGLSPENRRQLLPALWTALEFTEATDDTVQRLAHLIREAVDEETLTDWQESLLTWQEQSPQELGDAWWGTVQKIAYRLGLLGGADLRQAFRLLARLEPDLERPRVVARVEELDSYASKSPVATDLISFAASNAFELLLESAKIVELP